MKYVVLGLFITLGIGLCIIKIIAHQNNLKKQQWIDGLEHTASENVRIFENKLTIGGSSQTRTFAIYLPSGYDQDTVDYPVFYFLDGQSIFDQKILPGSEWQVDEVLDSLGEQGIKAIAVGIYNSEDRDAEYQPNFNPEVFDKRFTGNEHSEWIVNSVKPYIDQNYRTKSDASSTIIGGASFGGLMSYYILTEYPNVFGGAIIMSPSFWVNEKSTALDQKVKDMEKKYIYLSAGENERGIINGAKYLNEVLCKRGLKHNYRFEIEPNEIHRNESWRKMVHKSIPWIIDRINNITLIDSIGGCGKRSNFD